jgi:hypothetical protein
MTSIPLIAIAPPIISVKIKGTPSITLSYSSAVTIYTHPYAAYILPLAAGCKVMSHAKTANVSADGIRSHIEPPLRSQRYGK